MQEIWSAEIGRWSYYVIYSAQTTKWQLCRRHADPRDDDLVAQGVSKHRRPSTTQVLEEVREELSAITEEIQ